MIILKNTKDIDIVVDWCNTVYDYLLTLDSGYSNLIDYFRHAIETSTKKRKRVVREIYKETNLMARETLTTEQMASLNMILNERFCYSIADEIDNDTKQIQKIIKRGKILNDREFELVKNREDSIYADESQAEHAEILRNLLVAYECPDEKIM